MTKPTILDDIRINVKFKLAALWTSVMFCYVYGDYFSLYVPKKVEAFISGDVILNDPIKLFAASILMAIPSLMVFLSLALSARINRIFNIVFGIIYSAIMILIAVTSIAPWWTFYVFLAIVESCITLLIVWYAFRWPRHDTPRGIVS